MVSSNHVTVEFDTPINTGVMGAAFQSAGNTNDGEAQDDATHIGVDFLGTVSSGDPWTYTASLSTLTFVGGGTLANSAGAMI